MIEMQKEEDYIPQGSSDVAVISTKNPSSKKDPLNQEMDVTVAQTEADNLSKSRIDQAGLESNASLSKIINFENSTVNNKTTDSGSKEQPPTTELSEEPSENDMISADDLIACMTQKQ